MALRLMATQEWIRSRRPPLLRGLDRSAVRARNRILRGIRSVPWREEVDICRPRARRSSLQTASPVDVEKSSRRSKLVRRTARRVSLGRPSPRSGRSGDDRASAALDSRGSVQFRRIKGRAASVMPACSIAVGRWIAASSFSCQEPCDEDTGHSRRYRSPDSRVASPRRSQRS